MTTNDLCPRRKAETADGFHLVAASFASTRVLFICVRATSKVALVLGSVAVLLAGGAAAVRAQSALDGFDPNANGTIRAVVVQPDGKILIGGDFTTLQPNGAASATTRNHIARLNPNGTLDVLFNPNANLAVYAIAVQADGKILVGGDFVDFGNGTPSIGGKIRNSIARLDPTTGAADSWDPNANNRVRAIVVQADGKILAGGDFSFATPTIGGQTRNFIARLDPTTGLADSFNPNANSTVRAIAVQADGKILAGGIFTGIGGTGRNRIARLDPTTGAADTFNPNANNVVNAIVVQADGKILIGGIFSGANSIGGTTMRNRIARLKTDGTLDTDFDPNANNDVNVIAVLADGRILVGGAFTALTPNGGATVTRNCIARLDPTGATDSFAPNANGLVLALAVQADRKVVAGGQFTTLTPDLGPDGAYQVTRNHIARLETNGGADQTLNLSLSRSGVYGVQAIAVQPDGKIIIGGEFTSVGTVNPVPRNYIARFNADGTLDYTFNPNANGVVFAIAFDVETGNVLAGGDFTAIGGQMRNHIARLDGKTGRADFLDAGAVDARVDSIVVQADSKILMGGKFTTIGGQTRNHIARLDFFGAADSLDPNANGSSVNSIAVQADGKMLVGGDFTNVGGATRHYIARLDATTGLSDSFTPSTVGTVYSITLQPDGKILAGGGFSTRANIARLDPAGSPDAFEPDANDNVFSLAVQADGKIVVGGFFTIISQQTRNHIARLDPTQLINPAGTATGADDSFDPNVSGIGLVYSIAAQADGKVLVGGKYTTIDGQSRDNFARLSNDTAALQSLAVTQTAITWTRGGSSPQFTRVTFESSTDNVTYTPLGNGTASGNNWTLTGLNLPTVQNIYIRARGFYRSGNQNGSESVAESVRNAFLPPPTVLANISTRLLVETGDNVLIGGFIVSGAQPKKVLVRAIGPSLPLAGVLADPILELHGPPPFVTITNDNWRTDQEAAIIATGAAPLNDLESAIVATLPANNAGYTAIVRGVHNGTGIGVVEAYDLDTSANSKLANISTRGLVQTGDNVLIAGTIVLGQTTQRVIIRALGPSTGVPGALADPTLELHDGNGALVDANDNWKDSPNKQAIIDSTIPPPNDLESAIVYDLSSGGAFYTAIVRGVNNTTGVAVVEIYALN
jgi:uncharacterized delta-60 repeat protein